MLSRQSVSFFLQFSETVFGAPTSIPENHRFGEHRQGVTTMKVTAETGPFRSSSSLKMAQRDLSARPVIELLAYFG
jgi:hypothetical protein